MKLTWDPEHNIAYINIRERAGQVESITVGDDLVVDLAEDGSVVGFELLNANEQLRASDGGNFVFVDPTSGEERELKVA